MYGWRGRLGLIVPSSNTTNEPEFAQYLPDGVSVHTARMELADTNAEALQEMAADAERCATLLRTADVDVIAYGCTTGSLVNGPGYDEKIESQLSDHAAVPVVATAASIKRAFEALDLKSLSIVTPYITELNEQEAEFLEAAGYEITGIDGLGIEPNTEIGAQTPETAYRQARKLDISDADGIFVSCTNFRTFEIIDKLERDLGKPVVTSNQATLWDALQTIDVSAEPSALGTLFAK